MSNLLVKIYGIIPKSLRQKLGQSKWLKGIRSQILYNSGGFKTAKVHVNRVYGNYNVDFNFVASIKMASKAKHQGIENTVLRNSFKLIEKYKPNRTDLNVLDIGANFGYLSTVWWNSISKSGTVVAFEPNKNLHNSIKKTITANNAKNFEVYNLAAGNANKTIRLNASSFSSNIEKLHTAIASYDIEMITLDGFIEASNYDKIDLIKIDVDGIELDILKGAQNLLKQQNCIVIIETNDDNRIINFMLALDYQIFDMKLNAFENNSEIPLNIFCVPNALVNAI